MRVQIVVGVYAAYSPWNSKCVQRKAIPCQEAANEAAGANYRATLQPRHN